MTMTWLALPVRKEKRDDSFTVTHCFYHMESCPLPVIFVVYVHNLIVLLTYYS